MSGYEPGSIIVPEGAPRETWLFERGEGVTASEALDIARGGISTWRRILEQKQNGSTFRGNKSTRAGQSREAALIDEAATFTNVTPNGALWAAASNPLHRATPDGVGESDEGRSCVVEVKSHEYGWKSDDIPTEHLAQLQFQMHVTGAEVGLYGFEVRDEDDMPPMDGATWYWVDRDDEMIAWLTYRADQFIAWREAGCPDVDPLPSDVAAALAAWAPLKKAADDAARAEKTANAALKKAIGTLPHAERFGAVAMGEKGGFQLTVSTHDQIDEDAWRAGNPDGYRRVQEARVNLANAEAAALRQFTKTTQRQTLRFQEVQADA